MTRPDTGGSDRDRDSRERIARDQGDFTPDAAGAGDRVEREGPGGGRLGPLVRRSRSRGRRGPGDGSRAGGSGDGSREQAMVPPAEFRSYYGRQILKTPAWGDKVAYYFFAGGLSGGCALLAAGADVTGRPALRRGTRLGGMAALLAGMYYLVADLGRPDRFHHMLRVAKPSSPMSMGTWVVTAYAPAIGVAAAAEVWPRRWPFGRLIHALARPAGFGAAALAPALTSYGAVLLAQTAVPAWNSAHAELPFVFTSSAGAAAGGLGLVVAPPGEAEPARRLAVAGAAAELTVSRVMEERLGLVGETYRTGPAARYLTRATALTAAGGLGAALLGRRSRVAAAASGIALLGGSFYQRLAILHAGIQSTEDPKYVVQPQRARIAAQGPTRTR